MGELVYKCAPDLLLLVVIVETIGIDMEDLSEGEMSCLRATMIANVDEIMAEFFKCVPDLPLIIIVKAMGIDKEDLSEDQRTCLREWVTNAGWDTLLAASTIVEFATELAACGLDVSDDHADSIEGATATTVGEAIQGALNYEGDVDFFAFEAEGGVLYQIDVGLGTLPDSELVLYDSEELQLDYNDDHADSPASRIYWEAPSSGEYYAMVGGFGTGSYMLTVEALDIVDDHADSVEGATVVTVGEVVQGVLDYESDEDGFVFEAEEGQIYQIDVGLGTLTDSELWLYEVEEQYLGIRGVAADESRIVWKAPSSGKYYAEVSGYGIGSYTLAVAAVDVVDDHADSIEGATATTVGVAIQGTLDYEGDADFFAFEAEEGVLYQIDVGLGTLTDSELRLYDSDESELAYNNDRADSWASRISYWEAPSSGEYYAAVGGYGIGSGSYTLTVEALDIVDDHANSVEGATSVAVGGGCAGRAGLRWRRRLLRIRG